MRAVLILLFLTRTAFSHPCISVTDYRFFCARNMSSRKSIRLSCNTSWLFSSCLSVDTFKTQCFQNVFILLLHIPEQNRYFIELRSLKNLLVGHTFSRFQYILKIQKSIKHEIPPDSFFKEEKVQLFSSHHFVAVSF